MARVGHHTGESPRPQELQDVCADTKFRLIESWLGTLRSPRTGATYSIVQVSDAKLEKAKEFRFLAIS